MGGEGSRQSADGKTARAKFFSEFLKQLTIPFIKPVAEGFFENIRQSESLLGMHFLLFGFVEVEHRALAEYDRLLSSVLTGAKTEKRIAISPSDDPQFFETMKKRFDEALKNPDYGPFLSSSMQVLYSASISASWTAFECLSTDLWVTALNENPLPLAQTALGALDHQEPGELSSKHIPVGLAARYGFDLRHSLGTVLKPRFDFTSVSGIQRAYRVFVPTDDYVQKVLSEPLLLEMEATRHVIVHRGAKIDDEFKKRTGSTAEIGKPLYFTESKVAEFARVSQMTGFSLLAFVNDWFLERSSASNIK